MSKISLKANESGTGTFEIQAPATNTNRVLDLPDEAGKVLTDVSDIEPQVKTATNASGSAPIYACRAWVNFDGTGTVAIRASGNVSSVSRNGTGNYTVNFTTALADANYSAAIGAERVRSSIGYGIVIGGSATASSYQIGSSSTGGSATDFQGLAVAIFR